MNLLKKILVGCVAIFSIDSYGQCHEDYQLFWSDEFDLSAVDETKWVIKKQGGGFGNQEVQYYQPENASVSDGLLHIKVAKETVVDGATTYNYTSAKLETASKVNFLYGRMEASIKMPDVIGSWPAFWMLGSNIGSVGWPKCGEIDIVEWVGRGPEVASGSIFFEGNWPNNHLTTGYTIPQGQSFTSDFHTFAIEWEPNEIRYYCDGNKYATYKNSTIAPKNWYFNHEFFLILNCALGGSGGGPVIDIVEPKYMEVDYVRVYALPSTAESIVLKGPKRLMENSQNVLYTTTYFPNTTYDWSLPNGATIVDGASTNVIHVNFTTEGGEVSVTASNTCGNLTDAITLTLVKDACTIVYDDFDEAEFVTFESTGILTEKFENPLIDAVNSSAFVAKYERNILETYDVVGVNDIALETALEYENSSKVFFMDILTTAPTGTQITLQLENSALNAGSYPQGRRSAYVAMVSKQNEWHTVRFNFKEIISAGTQAGQVDHIALLFDPGNTTGDVYYFDNFKRLKSAVECPPITTDVRDQETDQVIAIYPNPVSSILHVKEKIESAQFFIFNQWGEKVMESKENKIDVTQLASGIYFLQTERKMMKFMKQ